MTLARVLTVLSLAAMLSGCAAVLVGGVAVGAAAAHDRRGASTVASDRLIGLKIRDALHAEGGPGLGNHIKITSHNGWVLLMGEVRSEDDRRRAGDIAAGTDDVRRVINELLVAEPTGVSTRSRDTVLTGQVKTALTGLEGIEGFNANRIKVFSVRSIVYLMGLVTREEGDIAAERASRVRGVAEVIKVFEYLEAEPLPSGADTG